MSAGPNVEGFLAGHLTPEALAALGVTLPGEQAGPHLHEAIRLDKFDVLDDGTKVLAETLELDYLDGELVRRAVTPGPGVSKED